MVARKPASQGPTLAPESNRGKKRYDSPVLLLPRGATGRESPARSGHATPLQSTAAAAAAAAGAGGGRLWIWVRAIGLGFLGPVEWRGMDRMDRLFVSCPVTFPSRAGMPRNGAVDPQDRAKPVRGLVHRWLY